MLNVFHSICTYIFRPLFRHRIKLSFKDAKLAESFGKSVEDFEDMPVNTDALEIVFDSLAESKAGIVKPEAIDKRRASWLTEAGGLDEDKFMSGINKARPWCASRGSFMARGGSTAPCLSPSLPSTA